MDDRLAFLQAEALQHRIHALGAEDPHQIVLQRDEEFRGAGVALAAGAAAQLVFDPAALMPLAAYPEEAARVAHQLACRRDLGADLRPAGLALPGVLDRGD